MSYWTDEQGYADLADELNDWSTHHGAPEQRMTVDDFDRDMVAAARRYARANGLAFPPGVGDFDTYWEQQHGRRRSAGNQ